MYIYTGDTDQWEPSSSLSTVTKPQPISASFKVPLVLNHSNPRKEEGGGKNNTGSKQWEPRQGSSVPPAKPIYVCVCI